MEKTTQATWTQEEESDFQNWKQSAENESSPSIKAFFGKFLNKNGLVKTQEFMESLEPF